MVSKKLFDKDLFTVKSSVGTISLISLTLPILFECVMNQLQGTVNTAVLSGYSETAVAAVGAATTIISVLLLFGSVIALGATVVVSNAIGAEDIKRAREVSFTSVLVSAGVALLLTPVLIVFARPILMLLNLEGEILEDAVIYFRIRIAFIFANMVMSSILALMKCYGYPKYTFIIGTLTNTLNLLLNIYVIYGSSSPVTGAGGVALACCISNVIGLLAAMWIFARLNIKLERPQRLKDLASHTRSILKIGIPSGISGASFTISQMVTTSFVALIGGYALSAKVYYTNILSYVYLFSCSAGNANAFLIGRRYGAGDYEKMDKMNAQLCRITVMVNLVISVAVVLLRRPLVGIFTDSEQIIALSLGIFLIDIITEQARAVSQVYEYALRAVGDVLFYVVFLIISCWVFSIGLAYFLAIKCNMGLIGCWIGLAADESVRMIVTRLRWKSGVWKK